MHYASGEDGLTFAPFVLDGTTSLQVNRTHLTIVSSVVLPNGDERVVPMVGALGGKGSVCRLEREGGGGPISLLLAEAPDGQAILLRELNATNNATILTSSLVAVGGDDGEAPSELIQIAHELSPDSGDVRGVQVWRMRPRAEGAAADGEEYEHDEEAYMYSGSEL